MGLGTWIIPKSRSQKSTRAQSEENFDATSTGVEPLYGWIWAPGSSLKFAHKNQPNPIRRKF